MIERWLAVFVDGANLPLPAPLGTDGHPPDAAIVDGKDSAAKLRVRPHR